MLQQSVEPKIVNKIQEYQNIKKEQNNKKILAWIIMVVAIIYGILPIDMIPDVPVIGWIDDFMINAVAVTNLIQQQFFQTNNTLNKLFNIAKWILIGLAVLILLIAVLIVTLIAKN